jgi:hypothetical protein
MPMPLVRDIAKPPSSRRPCRLFRIPFCDAFTDCANTGDGFFGREASQRPQLRDRLSIAGNNDCLAGFYAVQYL